MDGSQLRDLIGNKKPKYDLKYRALIEAISTKGDSSGKGDFSTFGAFYQTYMYAFIIGYHIGKPVFFASNSKTEEFSFISNWKPVAIKDYILMLLLNKTEDYNYKWIELENFSNEAIEIFVSEFIHQMEGYANAGFEYLQNKWDNNNMIFRNPFVFVKILEELNS